MEELSARLGLATKFEEQSSDKSRRKTKHGKEMEKEREDGPVKDPDDESHYPKNDEETLDDDMLSILPHSDHDSYSLNSDMSLSLQSYLFEETSQSSSLSIPVTSEKKGKTYSGERGRLFEIERRKHETEVNALKEQINSLEHEKKILEIDFDREQRRFHEELIALQNHSRVQMEKIQIKQATLQNEIPMLRKQLKVNKDELGNLDCPAATYQDLKLLGEDKQSLREFVLVKVFEITASLRERVSSLNEKLEEALKEKNAEKERANIAETSLSQSKKRLQNSISQLEMELSASEADASNWKNKYSCTLRENEDIRDKGERYDAVSARCDQLERDRAAALQQSEHAQSMCKVLETRYNEHIEKFGMIQEENKVLKVDKSYLEREVDSFKREVLRLQQSVEREQEKKREAKRAKEAYREKLQGLQAETRSEYEQKLGEEVATLKENNREQIEELKNVQQRLAEREIKHLQAAKEDALLELERIQEKYSELQASYNDTQLQLTLKESKEKTINSELRSEINMKCFQIAQLGNTLDVKSNVIDKLEAENEMLTKKIEVLKTEFSKLENASVQTKVELEARLKQTATNLEAYQALELELDTAIVQQAEAQQGKDVLRSLENIPSAARRRVQQSVALAQKLVRSERDLENARDKCKELETINLKLTRQIESLEKTVNEAAQPQAYVMDSILAKEAEIEVLKQQLEDIKVEKANALQTSQRLQNDLQTVLNERHVLQNAILETQSQRVKKGISSIEENQYGKDEGANTATAVIAIEEPGNDFNLDTSSKVSANTSNEESPAEEMSTEEQDFLLHEVDKPLTGIDIPFDHDTDHLNSSMSARSVSSSFILHKEDSLGIPLPKWYRRLRQPAD